MRAALITFFVISMVGVAGCEEEAVDAIDIELVQDPSVNTTEQVASSIDTIVMIVDSPDGLYSPGSERDLGDGLAIRDADGDAQDLELVVTVDVTDGHLPWIRLERGGLGATLLDLHLLGGVGETTEEQPVAEGLVRGVEFEEGIESLTIPFNIRPELLPPRVADVIPGDGESLPGCTLSDVVILFSKPVVAESLRGSISVEPGGEPLEILTDVSGIVAHLKIAPIESTDRLTFGVSVSTSVTDLDDRHLDDVPSLEGDQPFEREITLTCVEPTSTPVRLCEVGAPSDSCPLFPLIQCIDGECIPGTCDRAACIEPYLCSETSHLCELDCRIYGELSVCPDDRPRCDEETGLCVGD